MTDILFHAHSGIRYLVLLAGVVALLYMVVNMLRSRPWDSTGEVLLRTFIGTLDLQALLGIILLLVWAIYPALWGHVAMMVLAAVSAHVFSAINKRRPPERRSYALALTAVVLPLVLIIGGIMAIQRSIV